MDYYQTFLDKKLLELDTTNSPIDSINIESKLEWTESKADLTELIYALYSLGVFNHGNADLDNMLFRHCKEENIEWLCKSANDSIIHESLLDKEIEEADFYYSNGIGAGGMIKYDFNFDRIMNELFYPQTNFYFINVSKCDYLNDKNYLDETYEYVQNLPEYNGQIWEYIAGWSCEDFLKQCVERNNLLKYHLVSQEKYHILLEIIKDNNICDSSHKNIMMGGICHYPYINQQIIKI
jgi:hypothetical protein